MDALERIRTEVVQEITEHQLSSDLVWHECIFEYVGYYDVELVVADGARMGLVQSVVRSAQNRLALAGVEFALLIVAKWSVEAVGELEPLHVSGSGVIAASVVAITLRAGQKSTGVHVIFTWAASQALQRLAPSANLREAARKTVEKRLARKGPSTWDVLREPTIEISAAEAPYLSDLLKKAA